MARYLIRDYTHDKDIRTAKTLINARKAAIETFRKDKAVSIGMITIYDNGFLLESVFRNTWYHPIVKAPLEVEKYYNGDIRKVAGKWSLNKDGTIQRGI